MDKNIDQLTQEWVATLDVVNDPIFLHDEEFRILRCNKAYQKQAAMPFKQIIGQPYYEIFPVTHEPLHGCRSALEASESEEEVLSGETVFRSRSYSIHDEQNVYLYSVHILEDITARKQAENELRISNRALKLLSKCNAALIHIEDEQELLTEICRLAVETGGYLMAWVGFAEHDEEKTVRPVAQSGYEEGYLNGVRISWADTERGQGPTGTAIRTGRTEINQQCQTNPKMAPWRQAAIARGYNSSVGLPLIGNGRVFGALTIYSANPNTFGKEEVALLEELANDLAYGITTLRIRAEHEQFAAIQRQSLEQSIQTIAATVEARDPYTAGHQRHVCDLAVSIAREMGLSQDRIDGIRFAAIIHDLGKIKVPAEILAKPGRLNDIELELIKRHPQAGYDIIKDIRFPWPIAEIVLQHHERQDGSGYPRGLTGDAILPESRILAVADVIEAMASSRPYRPGLGLEVALGEIEKGKGRLYDRDVVAACQKLFVEGRLAQLLHGA